MCYFKLVHASNFLGLSFRKNVKCSVKITTSSFMQMTFLFSVGGRARNLSENPNSP